MRPARRGLQWSTRSSRCFGARRGTATRAGPRPAEATPYLRIHGQEMHLACLEKWASCMQGRAMP